MPRRPRRPRRAVVLAAALAAAAVPLAGAGSAHAVPVDGAAAAASRSVVMRFFDKPVDLVLTRADGTVIRNPTAPVAAGDVLDILSLDYRGTRARHARHAMASVHTRCTFAASGPPACVGHAALGGDLLVFTGETLTYGTGRFRGATGTAVSSAVHDSDNSSNVKVALELRG